MEDETCQQSSWGYCTPITKQGCECRQSWMHGGATCSSFCCNPDDDVGDWCYVVQESCQGSFWGYCNVTRSTTLSTTSTTTTSGRVTLAGCACQRLNFFLLVGFVHAAKTTGDCRSLKPPPRINSVVHVCCHAALKVGPLGLCRGIHRAQHHAAIRMVSMQTGVLWRTKRVSRPTGATALRSRSRDVRAKSRGHMVARLAHHTAAIRTMT